MPILDKRLSEENRDEGMQRAIDNADKKIQLWSDQAFDYLMRYNNTEPFLTEELRLWAYETGLPYPPTCRAWGLVMRRAANLGVIIHDGYRNVSNPKAHSTPASVWVKNKTF